MHRDAVAADGINDRKVRLRVRSFEIAEEVEHFREHVVGAGVLAVDLVDDHDDREVSLQALAQNEARLGKRAFRGVAEEQSSVGHHQGALDLATEVGVARGVDDVDLDVFPAKAGVLGKDGDSALALEIAGVHHPFRDLLVFTKGPALFEHCVHERGLAMVDVGDDGDIANVRARHFARRLARVRAACQVSD